MLYVQQTAELPLYEVEIIVNGRRVAHTLSNQYYVPVPHGQWGEVADFRVVPGIGQETAELLWAAGIYGWEQAAARDLTEIVGIGKVRAGAVRAYVLEHRESGLRETTYHNKVGGALDHASKTRMYRIWLASEIRRHPDQQVARQVFHLAGLVRDGHTVVLSTHPNNGAGRILARFVRWAIAEGRLPEAVPVARPADVRIHAAHDFVGANYAEEFESEGEIDLDAERLVWVIGRTSTRLGYVTEVADRSVLVFVPEYGEFRVECFRFWWMQKIARNSRIGVHELPLDVDVDEMLIIADGQCFEWDYDQMIALNLRRPRRPEQWLRKQGQWLAGELAAYRRQETTQDQGVRWDRPFDEGPDPAAELARRLTEQVCLDDERRTRFPNWTTKRPYFYRPDPSHKPTLKWGPKTGYLVFDPAIAKPWRETTGWGCWRPARPQDLKPFMKRPQWPPTQKEKSA